jgi:molecular chaperone HscA
VEAGRILLATRKGLSADGDLLEPGEGDRIRAACDALEEASRGADPGRIQLRIEALDDDTKAFAGRRMNRAISRAIEGKRLDTVEKTVEHAKGIEEAHAR